MYPLNTISSVSPTKIKVLSQKSNPKFKLNCKSIAIPETIKYKAIASVIHSAHFKPFCKLDFNPKYEIGSFLSKVTTNRKTGIIQIAIFTIGVIMAAKIGFIKFKY